MVERRTPLVLSSTRATLRSVLNSIRPDEIPGRPDSIRRSVRLPAGILRWKNDSKFDSLDDSSLVGLSTQLLKRLSINSGSFVVISNIDIGIQRIAQVVVLDPPPKKTLEEDASSVTSFPVSDSLHIMLVFPTFDTMSQQLLEQEVAYLSPMLAFNLSLHMSCLKSLVHRGSEVLEKYFVAKFDEESVVAGESKIGLDLEPVSEAPGYASHLRVSFVKIPECGTIQSLVVSSSFEDEERQGLIDSALNKYFGTDRVLSRGDVFRVCIEWNCGSSICVPCSQGLGSKEEDFVYFKVVAMEPSNEREVDKESSCEELVSKTMKLPLLSCLSPSSIHRAKEIDKVSDSYVEGALRRMSNTDLDAALMGGSKPELEDDVVAFPDQSVEGTESVNTRKDMEEGEHVDPVVKVSKSEEQSLKSKLPKAQKSRKSSSRNGLRGKDAAVNVINTSLPDKLQEDIGDSGEAKEQEQSSLVPKSKKENLSEESAVKESFNSVRNDEEAWKCEPDSKHPIKSSDLNKDLHNTKESVRSEVKNKHTVVRGMEPERELSGTCKKPKTGKSRFSALDQPGSNKTIKDIGKPSPHEDRKRKQKENKESGDCIRDAAVMEPSGEKVRKQKRLKGSSCDGKELPESCDRDRVVTQENSRDSASHQPLVHEAKGSLVDSLAPSALDPPELKSERISDRDKHHDTDSSAGDTRKRCRDGEGYITMDKPGTTRKAAESLRDNKEGYCTESEPQQEKAKESRNKKRPARKVSIESNKEDSSREHQDPINKLDNTNSTDQVEVLNHGREISTTKTKVMRHDDHVGSSPLKKEITSQAASNSIKEATDLKHIADRLKNAGNNHESIGFYFQAALKFLHGASLLESSGTENATHKSIVTSKHIYGSTAKLCKFCAHEYEKDKDMGAAALAYKCMEVAYLRITYSSHGNINRYKSELEASLQVIPSGESPSFASDGENPNKTLVAEKVALSTPVRSSPKVTGNHVLSSGNHSSLSQLLTF
ncbi:hypothetical protein DY000_02058318, partial [Brassica cretica]